MTPKPSLSSEDLVHAVETLLAQLSDAQVVALLHQHQPAIPEHGLQAFHTGQEAAHGVAWVGVATVFPQPVGMAATFDADLVREIGEAVGVELRAKHAQDPVEHGLNAWAPVVNPLRHPRWGRNEEGWSEDPYVTGWLASSYARGLRGDHEVFWRVVPTLKHLLAYNNETDRCTCSASLSPRVVHEYELPAFQVPVAHGSAGAVMPSYNLVNGRPTHVSAEWIDELRQIAPDLVTVSDAYAPTNLTEAQRTHPTRAASHAAAVRAGLDSFTDADKRSETTITALQQALDENLLTMDEVRAAARRLLLMRALTGELHPDSDPFVVGPDQIDTPEHRDLARRSAQSQVVVLHNNGVLPSSPGWRLAVVGPLADTVKSDWYSGTPPYEVGIASAAGQAGWQVSHDDAADQVRWHSTEAATRGQVLTRDQDGFLVVAPADDAATHRVTDWGDGTLTIADDATGLLWSGRHNGMIGIDATRPGGWVCQEEFREHAWDDGTVSIEHVGSRRWLRIEQFGDLVSATALRLDEASRFTRDLVSSARTRVEALAAEVDEVWVVVGNDPHLLGRETADRPSLDLPHAQRAICEAALGHDAPTVLVVVSSYPYALGDLVDRCDAVVWSSHAGQELGHAVADVVSGAVEPRARLAQTWWASEDDIGDLFDYDVIGSGLTYQYNEATPQFAFGHGLGYSPVDYSQFVLDRQHVRVEQPAHARALPPDDTVAVASVTLANTGERVVHELVQLYASSLDHPLAAPRRVLLATQWVELQPGERVEVDVPVTTQRLATWSVRTQSWRVEPSRWQIFVGHDCLTACGEAELVVEADPAPPHSWPLTAWNADHHARVQFIATSDERGSAAAVEPGADQAVVRWDEVAVTGPVTVRARRGRDEGGLEVAWADQTHDVELPTQAWGDVHLDLPPGEGSLELRMTGSAQVWRIDQAT
ncbi:beta-glucosidase family protein [Aestuariimicrobium ganziense]|uniref:beta-glucosidase family protein n=1 Tax=Aestuariimicrobium ganziense TaxID=2773677 RepID=UPI001945A77C|nr:glycoside hydrolase family 3 C-terminal domain-containing protein [Aestuariimicrobium ganziense]